MICKRDVGDQRNADGAHLAATTFRTREGNQPRWVSGHIGTFVSNQHTSGLEAAIKVTKKVRGRLLHVGEMTATLFVFLLRP